MDIEASRQAVSDLPVTVRLLHSPYRDGQSVIRDSASSRIIYMPPEAPDVATLMGDLFT